MTKFDNDYINNENRRRHKQEKEDVFPSMFTNLKSLKLKRIPLIPDINNNENEHVKEGVYYLFAYSGFWHVSTARRTYHKDGWEFSSGWSTPELGWVDALFEIEGLTNYNKTPLGRLDNIRDPNSEEYDWDLAGEEN